MNCDAMGRTGAFGSYKLLVVPMLGCVDDQLADKLIAFASNGGTLIWHPFCGMTDPEGNVYPGRIHHALELLLGVRLDDCATTPPEHPHHFFWQGRTYKAEWSVDLVVPQDASVMAEYQDAWFSGSPAVTRRPVGAGEVFYVTTFAESTFYSRFFEWLGKQRSLLGVSGMTVPRSVEMTVRRDRRGSPLVFLLNPSPDPQTMHLTEAMEDVWA